MKHIRKTEEICQDIEIYFNVSAKVVSLLEAMGNAKYRKLWQASIAFVNLSN